MYKYIDFVLSEELNETTITYMYQNPQDTLYVMIYRKCMIDQCKNI